MRHRNWREWLQIRWQKRREKEIMSVAELLAQENSPVIRSWVRQRAIFHKFFPICDVCMVISKNLTRKLYYSQRYINGRLFFQKWKQRKELSFMSVLIICVCLFTKSCLNLATLWTVARQTPLSHGIVPGKHTGVGCHFPSPGDLPNPGIKLTSSELAGRFFTTEPQGKPLVLIIGDRNGRWRMHK